MGTSLGVSVCVLFLNVVRDVAIGVVCDVVVDRMCARWRAWRRRPNSAQLPSGR
jgi:hypothetical protein